MWISRPVTLYLINFSRLLTIFSKIFKKNLRQRTIRRFLILLMSELPWVQRKRLNIYLILPVN